METVKDKEGRRWHVGCGGEVIKGICIKCGEKKKGLISRLFGDEPLVIRQEDIDRKKRMEHRKRIREGRDIFRE